LDGSVYNGWLWLIIGGSGSLCVTRGHSGHSFLCLELSISSAESIVEK